MRGADSNDWRQHMDHAVIEQVTRFIPESRHVRPQGSVRLLVLKSVPFADHDEGILAMFCAEIALGQIDQRTVFEAARLRAHLRHNLAVCFQELLTLSGLRGNGCYDIDHGQLSLLIGLSAWESTAKSPPAHPFRNPFSSVPPVKSGGMVRRFVKLTENYEGSNFWSSPRRKQYN
jgi:hypothetical protein